MSLFSGYCHKIPGSIIRYFVTTIEKLCCIVFQKQTLSDTQKIIYFENSQENVHGCAKF